jgi:hypothetical protein
MLGTLREIIPLKPPIEQLIKKMVAIEWVDSDHNSYFIPDNWKRRTILEWLVKSDILFEEVEDGHPLYEYYFYAYRLISPIHENHYLCWDINRINHDYSK